MLGDDVARDRKWVAAIFLPTKLRQELSVSMVSKVAELLSIIDDRNRINLNQIVRG